MLTLVIAAYISGFLGITNIPENVFWFWDKGQMTVERLKNKIKQSTLRF